MSMLYLSILVAASISAYSLPPAVRPAQRPALRAWLAGHRPYRVVDEAECACDDELFAIRHAAVGHRADRSGHLYHPYYAEGDFDGDGKSDFAVVVADRRSGRARRVLIFTRSGAGYVPFLSGHIARESMLFADTPPPARTRLTVGSWRLSRQVFDPAGSGLYHLH